MESIKGRVKNYVFYNKENSYSIARVMTQDMGLVTIVGYFPIVSEDVIYEFHGNWVNHTSYGQQFKIESFKKLEEQSASGLISYLSSNLFHGIGLKTAEKMVNHFGTDVIKMILKDKKILKEIGLSNVRIEKFYQQLIENQTNEHILVALYQYQISGKTAMKLLNQYQMLTLEKIEENPYRLIDDIEGIGFIKADEIAFKLGIEKNDPRRIKASILYALENIAYQNGDIYLTRESLDSITQSVLQQEVFLDESIEALILENKIVLEDERYYLASAYFTEIGLAKDLIRISEYQLESDQNYLETLLDSIEIQKNVQYTKVQKEAIITALINPLSIITGGPGTGKTTIIDGLLEVYRSYHRLNIKSALIHDKIGLMAPTGRAAKRMKELLNMDAKTIHRHLGYNYDGQFSYDEYHPMPFDLVVIDEASMIDLFLAKRLFQAIKNGSQVVIVGDVDQLPSVGPGQFLSDLIQSSRFPVVKLNEIHRQAKDSKIISLSRAVNEQRLSHFDLSSDNDLYLYKTTPEKIIEIMKKQIQGAINEGYDLIEDIQVLAPMYKGELGIDNLNRVLQETFNPNLKQKIVFGDKTFYIGDKVIQLSNDPEKMIMNGDIGVIKDIRTNQDQDVYLRVLFDDHEVEYDKNSLDDLSLAYAISIHKSQGSEYKIVIMPMVKSYMNMLKKELIYTAMTRSKKFLIILGDMNLLIYAANHLSEKRKTTLALRLNQNQKIDEIEDEDSLSPYDFMT